MCLATRSKFSSAGFVNLFLLFRKRKVEENGGEVPAKKRKSDANEPDEHLKKLLKEQADTFWAVKKDIQDHVTQEEIETILQANGRYKRKRDGKEGVGFYYSDSREITFFRQSINLPIVSFLEFRRNVQIAIMALFSTTLRFTNIPVMDTFLSTLVALMRVRTQQDL